MPPIRPISLPLYPRRLGLIHTRHSSSRRSPQNPCLKRFASTDVSGVPNPFQNSPRRISLATFILALIPITTFGLGVWQVRRLQWKVDLIAQVDEALSLPPMNLPPFVNVDRIPDFAWRRVELKGRYEHEHEILVGPRGKEGRLVYDVYTPFVREDGTRVIINRGWIWSDFVNPNSRPESLTKENVQVIGMLRSPVPKNYFTPKNVPEKNQWVFPDQEEMSKYLGTQAVLVDEIFEGNAGEVNYRKIHGVPLGRAPTISLRNMHATYAGTWFSICLISSVGLYRLIRKKPR